METRRFFSRMINGSATEVRRQISKRGQTDWWRWNNAFSWNDQRRRHHATSSMRGLTDQWQNHDASSLGWSTVQLVTCNGKSTCEGGLIDSDKTMLFSWYDWWRWHNATSTGHGWNDWRQRQGTSSLGWSTVWLLTCDGESACAGRLINGSNTMLFLGMIDGGNTTLLLAGADGLINGRDKTLLLSAGQRFG